MLGAWVLAPANRTGIRWVMPASKPARRADGTAARTIRFPARVRERIATDADRCGRSFEAQVIAILRRHYGEDVDLAPAPDFILALACGSFAGMTRGARRLVTRPILEDDET